MRALSFSELDILEILGECEVVFSLQELTETGRSKSIMDAVHAIRVMLKRTGLHDYDEQGQGQENKRVLQAYYFSLTGNVNTSVSVYRPNTKKGDPRIWVKGLKSLTSANDIILFFVHDDQLYVANLTELSRYQTARDVISAHFSREREGRDDISIELLQKIADISRKGWVPSLRAGDTGIGFTLETLLGIPANSSKTPDYKGIELKSARARRTNRKTLFGKVPNWKLSKLKSSEQVLKEFGYWRDGCNRLNCTVSALKPNSQGLYFVLGEDEKYLYESSSKEGLENFLTWPVDGLMNQLARKHRETFWVSADSKVEAGSEFFHFKSVIHTKNPNVQNLALALRSGVITMDHLIKDENGSVQERGPLFKLKKGREGILFPTDVHYDLS